MIDILIVEDNRELGSLLCDFLRGENYTVAVYYRKDLRIAILIGLDEQKSTC